MLANRILNIILGIAAFFVVPVQIITTLIIGLLVSVSFRLLLIPISLVWALLAFPMIGASWFASRVDWLRNPIGILGIPWAFCANTFVALMPAMGELESRAAKLMLTEAWPYSWEYWSFQTGKLNLYDPDSSQLYDVINRISRRNPLMQRTVSRLALK